MSLLTDCNKEEEGMKHRNQKNPISSKVQSQLGLMKRAAVVYIAIENAPMDNFDDTSHRIYDFSFRL